MSKHTAEGDRRQPPSLGRAQLKVLAALDDLLSDLGHAPTYAEILRRIGWSPNSGGSLHRYLNELRELGVIAGSGRSLRVVDVLPRPLA